MNEKIQKLNWSGFGQRLKVKGQLPHPSSAGFTVAELLISLAVASIVLTIGAINLASFRSQQNLANETRSLTALLTTARERSMGQDNESRWGVFITNNASSRDTYSLFEIDEVLYASSTYLSIPGTTADTRTVRSGIEFVSPTSGTSIAIVFDRVSGLPEASTTLSIQNTSSEETIIIRISGNGRIDYE